MKRVRETIIVEGRYDANMLHQCVDAHIVETSGFGIFNNSEKRKLITMLAEKNGIIVLTDSDGAGFVIRNHLKAIVGSGKIKHAYIPEIYGKERRKRHAGKEGKMGVEGMKPDVLIEALRRAGATFLDEAGETVRREPITKVDLFACGLSGGADSTAKRQALLKRLDLPEHLTANGMLEALNLLYDRDSFLEMMETE